MPGLINPSLRGPDERALIANHLSGLKCGDIYVSPTGDEYAKNSFGVMELLKHGVMGVCIPTSVTKGLQSPVQFYSEYCPSHSFMVRIFLDIKVHARELYMAGGDRPVTTPLPIYYGYYPDAAHKGTYSIQHSKTSTMGLSDTTPIGYLINDPALMSSRGGRPLTIIV